MAKQTDNGGPNFQGIIRNVSVLGFEEKPTYHVDGEGLHITTSTVHSEFPVVIKIQVE